MSLYYNYFSYTCYMRNVCKEATPMMQTTQTPIRLRGCAGRVESSLDPHVRRYVFLRWDAFVIMYIFHMSTFFLLKSTRLWYKSCNSCMQLWWGIIGNPWCLLFCYYAYEFPLSSFIFLKLLTFVTIPNNCHCYKVRTIGNPCLLFCYFLHYSFPKIPHVCPAKFDPSRHTPF